MAKNLLDLRNEGRIVREYTDEKGTRVKINDAALRNCSESEMQARRRDADAYYWTLKLKRHYEGIGL